MHDSQDPLVLVVEDDQDLCDALVAVMDLAGYRSVPASNGEEGWAVFQAEQPDLVITDVQMPVLDGFGLLDRIREQFDNAHKYVIMISGQDDPDLRVDALNRGANDFLRKPFAMRELIARVEVGARAVQVVRDLDEVIARYKARLAVDEATGLINQDAFMERYHAEIARASRYGRNLTCVVVTVDNMDDLVSDADVHPEDSWLWQAGRVLRELVRRSDVVARFDTDQFSVLLPETDEENAHLVVDKIESGLGNGRIRVSGERKSPQLRVGLASYQAFGTGLTNLVTRAAEQGR